MEEIKAFENMSEYDGKSITQDDPDSTSFLNYSVGQGSRFQDVIDLISSFFSTCWNKTLGRIEGDWVFLTLLGISLAWISHIMEYGIKVCTQSRFHLYEDLAAHPLLQYIGWLWIPVCLILFSSGFTKLVAPQAAGSGIPEMITIFKGAYLKETLTFKALVAKVIGLTAVLGTGLSFGKEGPFVHIACMVAMLLTKATSNIRDVYKNRSRHSEILSAACAVGVATAFATPVGGVLFSIEVTAVNFAVRNYWRGFYAAVCCTLMNRLLAVLFKGDGTFQALFKTSFNLDVHYAPQEIFAFAFIGVVCGLLGALFVWMHRQYMTFKKTNSFMIYICNKSFLLYPLLVTLIYTSLTFPLGLGMFMAGKLTSKEQVLDLFGNFSWQNPEQTVHEFNMALDWINDYTGLYVNLVIYIIFTFIGTIMCITLPVPGGVFTPAFKIGAALGRLVGEILYALFPMGVNIGNISHIIIPGGYAIVGAAALAGAVTHTVSVTVIAFEISGQITYAIPIMVAVFIANAVAQSLQPSIFESIIRMKKLPYLPSIPSTSSKGYNIFVEDFMIRDVKFIWYGMTYEEIKNTLLTNRKLNDFPIVDSPDSMVLLGSAHRKNLIAMIKEQIGEQKKLHLFNEWKVVAEKSLAAELKLKNLDSPPMNKKEPETVRIFEAPPKPETKSETEDKGPLANPKLPSFYPQLESIKADSIGSINDDTLHEIPIVSSERRPSRFSVTKVEGAALPSFTAAAENKPKITKDRVHIFTPSLERLEDWEEDSPEVKSNGDAETDEDQQTTEGETKDKDHETKTEDEDQQTTEGETKDKDHETKTEDEVQLHFNLDIEESDLPASPSSTITQGTLPKKSILKKTQSFVFEPNKNYGFSSNQFYNTIHGDESRSMKQSLAAFLKAKSLLRMDSKASHLTFTGVSRADLPTGILIQRIKQFEQEWEEKEMQTTADFSKCRINPAPHQLVERSNLLQVHSIFSLLGLNHSYVTAIGRLIGVVSLKELRSVIERINSGDFTPRGVPNNRRYSYGFVWTR